MAARYMMAAHPAFFHVSQSHILNHMCSEDFRNEMGFAIRPRSIITLLMAPKDPNTLKAMEYTSTHEIKFGSVVTVCTNFLYGLHRISLRNTAKTMGNQENSSDMPLMANVLRITLSTSCVRTGLEKICWNHFRPTKVSAVIGKGGR